MSPSPPRPWHFAQTPSNVSSPSVGVAGFLRGSASSSSHCSNSSRGSASTSAFISACWTPQNSAHWPR